MSRIINCCNCKSKDPKHDKCLKHRKRIYKNLNNSNVNDKWYYPCVECKDGQDYEPKLQEEFKIKFELGKCYQHATGSKLYICGLADTYYYGRGLIGEDERGELSIVGDYEENAINYHEITREQFI